MKILSINTEKTVGFKLIAFNVDEELAPDFVSKIHYGTLKITGAGTVLTVQLPADADTLFTSESVKSLNQKLKSIEDEFVEANIKRHRMLQAIASNTGLPLD